MSHDRVYNRDHTERVLIECAGNKIIKLPSSLSKLIKILLEHPLIMLN